MTTLSSSLHSNLNLSKTRRVHFQLPPRDSQTILQDGLAAFRYHAYTLYLFIASDIKTTLIPSFIFGILSTRSYNNATSAIKILTWLFLHLLTFCISNQSKPSAVIEDKLNKPWRPLPAGRITSESANTLKVGIEVLSIVFSITQGNGIIASLLLMLLTWSYNNFGDAHWLSRNVICAGGLATFAHGAASVAGGGTDAWRGVLLIAAVVATTMQASDMYDQEGDRACGRKTIPLRFGDGVARFTLALGIAVWSCLVCTRQIAIWQSIVTGVLGVVVASGMIRGRTPAEDRKTFKYYCVWLMSIYVVAARS